MSTQKYQLSSKESSNGGNEGQKNDIRHTGNKMAKVSASLLIITLNVLNSPIKKQIDRKD